MNTKTNFHKKNSADSATQTDSCADIENVNVITSLARNTILIDVDKKRHRALVDTGASISCMSKSIFDKLSNETQSTLDPTLIPAVRGVGGELLSVLGKIVLTIDISGLKIDQTFHVIDNIQYPFILGIDFLKMNKVHLDFNYQKLSIAEDTIVVGMISDSQFGRAKCTKYETIEPETEKLIKVKLTKDPGNQVVLLEPFESLQNSDLAGARCIAQGKTAYLKIMNPTKKKVKILPGQFVANVSLIDKKEIFDFDENDESVNVASMSTSSNQSFQNKNQSRDDFHFEINNPNLSDEQKQKIRNFLNNNKDVFSTSLFDIGKTDVFTHKIETDPSAKPVHLSFYRQDPIKKAETERLVKDMLESRMIQRSTSIWNSPVVLVKKKDNSWRFAVDYRKLNQITFPISHPLPRIEDVFDSLGNSKATIFSTLDLNSAYFQLALDPETRHKASFVTHEGVYEWLRMPFGLRNAPMSFQMLMSIVLQGLNWKFVLCYIDDILVFSRDVDTHIKHLSEVFARLRKANLTLKPSKCSFAVNRVNFLGHILTQDGVETDPSNIDKVKNFPVPRTQKEVRAFLGLCNFYRRFVKNYSKIILPLNSLLKKDAHKKFSKTDWTQDCQNAFETLRNALLTAPVLRFPDINKPFILSTDASGSALGYVLGQKDDHGREYVVSYGGRALRPDEKNWNISELECLAVVEGIENYKHYPTVRKFDLYTDHAALLSLKSKKEPKGRLTRWAIELQGYDFALHHRKGSNNANADALSRIDYERLENNINSNDKFGSQNEPTSKTVACVGIQTDENTDMESQENQAKIVTCEVIDDKSRIGEHDDRNETLEYLLPSELFNNNCICEVNAQPVEHTDVKDKQRSDPFCNELIQYLESQILPDDDKKARDLTFYSNEFFMRDGVLYHWFTPRVKNAKDQKKMDSDKMLIQLVVPKCLQKEVLNNYHDGLAGGGHSGIKKTYAALKLKYYWNGMHQDVCDYAKTCDTCQKNKTSRRRHPVPLTPLPVGSTFERLHIDILCSLPKPKEGYQYILLIVDSFSKWTEAFPLKTQEATEIADILTKEIICRYGAPRILVSDRGRNFMSKLISAICEFFNITRHHTSSYHPQTNSTVERMNSTLAQTLRTYIDKDQTQWVDILPFALMNLRAKPCTESTQFSPFKLLFGKEMELPVDTSLIPKPSLQQSAQTYLQQLNSKIKSTSATAKQNQEKMNAKAKARHDAKAKEPDFKMGDKVLLKKEKTELGQSTKLSDKWVGPYEIIEKALNHTYKIKHLIDNKNHPSLVNACRLKHYHERQNEDEQPQSSDADQANDSQNNEDNDNNNISQSSRTEEPLQPSKDGNTKKSQPKTEKKRKTVQKPAPSRPMRNIEICDAKTSGSIQWYRIKFEDNTKGWYKEQNVPSANIQAYLEKNTKQGKKRKKTYLTKDKEPA